MAPIKNPVKLSNLRATATQLKKHVEKADLNGDGLVSVNEVRTYGKRLGNGNVAGALTVMTTWTQRQQAQGSRVPIAKVKDTIDAAMKAIAKKDVNHNGVVESGKELKAANQLGTFQALARLAERSDVMGTQLTAKELGKAVAPLAKTALHISEADYHPQFITADLSSNGTLTAEAAVKALGPTLTKFYTGEGEDPSTMGFRRYSASEAKSYLKGLSASSPDDDADMKKSARAFGELVGKLEANLSDLQVIRYGPKDSSGKVTDSQGLYADMVVGRTKDGKLAGVLIGTVET